MVKGWKKMDNFKDLHRGARAAGCLVKYIDCMIVSFLPSVGCDVFQCRTVTGSKASGILISLALV